MSVKLDIETPRWALPLLDPARYKGAKGGRSAGRSYWAADSVIEAMVCDPSKRVVCIREIQRSLRYSAKSLIERRIQQLGVSEMFSVMQSEIRRNGGDGVCIFEGMQSHNAGTIKSLDGFHIAWIEEAQRLSQRSLDMLIPTIREDGSELWFTWNPNQDTDPVDQFLVANQPENAAVVHATYLDNPWLPKVMRDEAERMKRLDPDAYRHIWLGEYNQRSDSQVLAGRYRVDEFEPNPKWDGPYFGADWGFSQDPTAIVKCWIGDNRLWIEHEAGGVGVDLVDLPELFLSVPGIKGHWVQADNARPETISFLHGRSGLKAEAAPKWSGSVEDGVAHLRGAYEEIVIHERCEMVQQEAALWRYKVDRLTDRPTPKLADGHDHYMDAIRYALARIIQQSGGYDFVLLP